jgi:WD40 repeat protein
LLACYDGFDDVLFSMSVAHNGKSFATAGTKVLAWNIGEAVPNADLTKGLQGKLTPPLHDIAISPDDLWLAAGDNQGQLWIWNRTVENEPTVVQAHRSAVVKLAFSLDSQQLATTGHSGATKIWRVADGKEIRSIEITSQNISNLLFVAKDRLAVVGASASIWNTATGAEEHVLSPQYVRSAGLALSGDAKTLLFSDNESRPHFWDIARGKVSLDLPEPAGAIGIAAFSDDGKWVAASTGDSVQILDATSGQILQVIDSDGGTTTALSWLPGTQLLVIASLSGKLRVWGIPELAASTLKEHLELPKTPPILANTKVPATCAQLVEVLDLRSQPRLPDAKSLYVGRSQASYTTRFDQQEAERFYRYVLNRDGWTEVTPPAEHPGLQFEKTGCLLNLSFYQSTTPDSPGLNVSLNCPGNFDSRWIPDFPNLQSSNQFSSFTTTITRSEADLSDIEVTLIRELHKNGWTGISRLNASTNEQPDMRLLNFIQHGIELSVLINRTASDSTTYTIQTSVSVADKSLPIPSDAGWIEFDASTDLRMVANTKMKVAQAMDFYDDQMLRDGWIKCSSGRTVDETSGWARLPYIQGQREVTIQLRPQTDDSTRIVVGEVDKSSWQLKTQPEAELSATGPGIEVADWILPKGATSVRYNVDQKQLTFELPEVSPTQLDQQYTKQLADLGWQREAFGVNSDEYISATHTREKLELNIRYRLMDGKNSSVSIDGSGLLWNKPLPVSPQRVSYGTWLMRHRYAASLDRLDEFTAEMARIPK